MQFLDQAKIYIASGAGGDGAVSFRREKYVEYGGPDGGDGGKGGDIIFECVDGLNTLIDFRYTQHFKAKRGAHGMGRNRTGAMGQDLVLRLPPGTEVIDAVSGGMDHGILDDHTVDEAMTRGPLTTIAPDAPAARAAELMQQEQVHRLPVVENDRLVGIITTTDLVKAVADRKLSYRTFVFP